MTDSLESGICYGKPSLIPLFFSDSTSEQKTVKRMCFRCPVQLECLEGALQRREKFGVWGGCLPSERLTILKLRRESVPRSAVADLRYHDDGDPKLSG